MSKIGRRGFLKAFTASVAGASLVTDEVAGITLAEETVPEKKSFIAGKYISTMPAGNRIAVHVEPLVLGDHNYWMGEWLLEGRTDKSKWKTIYAISEVGANVWLQHGKYDYLRLSRYNPKTPKKRKLVDEIKLEWT